MVLERLSVREALSSMLTPETEARAREALTAFAATQTPWYLRLVIGVGAWLGSWFLLSFIVGSVMFALGKESASVLGGVLLAGAVLLRRASTGQLTRQIALVVGFTGQAMLIGGVGDITQSVVAASITALIVSAVLIAVFPDRVQRFASTLVFVGALATLVYEWKVLFGMEALALALLLAPLMLWRVAPRAEMEAASEIVEPVVFGLVISLFGLLIADMAFTVLEVREVARLGLPTVVGFTLMLLWLASAILIEHGVPMQRPESMLALAGIAAIGALTRTTPAIVATMAIIALGFDRRSRGLVTLATTFFLAFGGFYYYNLQLTLLQKSGVLAASGIVCLLAAALLRTRVAAEAS